MKNLVLIGMPGSGKTSIGKLLSKKLGMEVIDFDDHIIEVEMHRTVGQTLETLGEDIFLDMEEKFGLEVELNNQILSASGSLPLRKKAMDHLRKQAHVIYIDIPVGTIQTRLERMKVDRILGMKTMTLREILEYRQGFYEESHDFRFKSSGIGTKEETFEEFWEWFKTLNLGFSETEIGNFIETRGNDNIKPKKVKFSEAILNPSASFGGLYIPEILPPLGISFLKKHLELSYSDIALDLLHRFNIDILDDDLMEVLELYNNFDNSRNPDPLVKIKDDLFVCELFHGPTRAFKDMALQPFGGILSKLAKRQNKEFLIMVATSGDTGPAALESLANKEGIKVVCLYPNGGTSDVQRLQMVTNSASNIKVLGINGNFDDAQNSLKNILKSESFREKLKSKNIELSAANSVNFGRIIFQIIYHFHSYLQLIKSGEIDLGEEIISIVPSGNFGNVLGGYYAKKMGLPIKKFLIASNKNNILTDFINTGKYDLRNRKFEKTSAPAMDILISSNIERILFHEFGENRTKELLESLAKNNFYKLTKEETEQIQETFGADFTKDEEIYKTIKEYSEEENYLMDPHTATGIKLYNQDKTDTKKVIFSTAEWTKFAPTIINSLEKNNKEYSDKEALIKVSEKLNIGINKNISEIFNKEINHKEVIDIEEIENKVLDFLK